MGLFSRNKENYQERIASILARLEKNECAQLFSEHICSLFSPNTECLRWLLDAERHHFEIEVETQGVTLVECDFTRQAMNDFKEGLIASCKSDYASWGFGASGYQDLPDHDWAVAFKEYLLDEVRKNCRTIEVGNGGLISVSKEHIQELENAKKSW